MCRLISGGTSRDPAGIRLRSFNEFSLAILEEMQHTNSGSGAAKITDILLTMAAIGVPMVFVCNYSLAHKLLGRNSEDKQRLLADPRSMLPDEPGSANWLNDIAECLRASYAYVKADIG
ncbi:hypothetical protein HBO43_17470 [Pseudomonas veronii]|uniref:Uncharacterized protein n=1 Tax=Pseudomonas veronii TaxID=76761 RepID=A0A7Y0ZUR0_PSEVE|nr:MULTISPECIES: hypothetical protein [Pseudomonas]KAA0950613.1 hypothetical protein FQ182_02450 [Pseudomonas sp. ANT_H4]KAA0952460.1 hypothetical protein FQ186_10565 [Pseudomonas sp. ANT_H14]MBC8781818.1 hypothetical protein [Pseudomonas fluorescens]NMX98397.1 hypothetical protein [Pseudomonas veronii]OPK01989.1 hypothetical protein BZ164_24970 [Pseudomonas veronii]